MHLPLLSLVSKLQRLSGALKTGFACQWAHLHLLDNGKHLQIKHMQLQWHENTHHPPLSKSVCFQVAPERGMAFLVTLLALVYLGEWLCMGYEHQVSHPP